MALVNLQALLANLGQAQTSGSAGTTSPSSGTTETWTGMTAVVNMPTAVTGTSFFAINDTNSATQSELIWVTNVSGSTWTVKRGAEGTTPVAHATGATFQWVLTKITAGTMLPSALNVRDYGAVADNGVTGNLTAFNNCAADAAALGVAVYVPGNVNAYGLEADWVLPTGLRVWGHGAYAFKNPGTTVPANNAGGFYGSVLMPQNSAAFTNAVVQVGTNGGLENIAVVGNIAGWTAGAAASAHNAARAIQVIGKGARLEHVLGWGGLACAVDLGDGSSGNTAQDTTLIDVVGNQNLNPPLVITVAGCSWINGNTTITTTGNFTTAGIIPGMTLSPTFNGIQLGCVVVSVSTTTLVVSNAPFNTNAGPVTLEFIGGIGIRLAASSDCMLDDCRTSSACVVIGGGNTDCVNCHWSAGATSTNWFEVYCQTTGGYKSTGDVFDCATQVAGLIRRDRGIVQLTGPRCQNLNNTGTALPAFKDNEPSGVSSQGAWHIEGGTFTVGTASTPDGFSYIIDFTGTSGTPGLSSVHGATIDAAAVQHGTTIFNGGSPGITRGVMIGTNPLMDTGGQPEPWLPSDNALLAANMDFVTAGAAKTLTNGTLYLMKVHIRQNMTWTNVLFSVTGAGAGASTGSFVGLYSSAGTLLSGSADIAASLTATGAKSVALTTPQALTAGTFVWVAILENLATTAPQLQGSGVGVGASNINLATAALRFAVNGTGITALPASITPGSNTGTGSLPLAVAAT